MLLIVSIIITAELYSTFKYHMKIGETTRCCSFFLRTHVKFPSKISIIEFNIQIKWCIIVTPSREAEKDYQGYFNSSPHKKNHIATTMINTVLFKISTHILTKRMTSGCTDRSDGYYFNSHPHEEDDVPGSHILRIIPYFNSHPHEEDDSSSAAWRLYGRYFNSHPHEEDDTGRPWIQSYPGHFNSHPHEEDDRIRNARRGSSTVFQLTSSRRGWPSCRMHSWSAYIFQLTSSRRGWRLLCCFQRIHFLFQLTSSRRGWQ